MKGPNDIISIVANGIAKAAGETDGGDGYKIVVCPERIFIDDYKPAMDEYIARIRNADFRDGDGEYSSPRQTPYQKTIFFVLKLGAGQMNFAVWEAPFTIQCLSEQNEIDMAREIFMKFISNVNFLYKDGVVQSYFTPTVSSSIDAVYEGFRALLSCNGFVRVPEDGIVFASDVCLLGDDGETMFSLPFVNLRFSHAGQPDPQAFSGYYGHTMGLVRQATQTFALTTYLWHADSSGLTGTDKSQMDFQNGFTDAVLDVLNENINRKFRFVVRTSIPLAYSGYSASVKAVDGEVVASVANPSSPFSSEFELKTYDTISKKEKTESMGYPCFYAEGDLTGATVSAGFEKPSGSSIIMRSVLTLTAGEFLSKAKENTGTILTHVINKGLIETKETAVNLKTVVIDGKTLTGDYVYERSDGAMHVIAFCSPVPLDRTHAASFSSVLVYFVDDDLTKLCELGESGLDFAPLGSKERREPFFGGWFVLTNFDYSQKLGDVSMPSIVFTQAKKEED